jgi:DNA-binding NtrC family response regulator
VTSLGGELTFESTPGKGSVFRVLLDSALPLRKEEPPLAPAETMVRRGRVLVIDDEPMIGASLRVALAPQHEVLAETVARRALKRLVAGGERFDLILCDLMMPGVNGMDFFEELERAAPEVAARVVFVTGGAFTDRARAFVEKARVRCFEKPFDIEALDEEIRKRMG